MNKKFLIILLSILSMILLCCGILLQPKSIEQLCPGEKKSIKKITCFLSEISISESHQPIIDKYKLVFENENMSGSNSLLDILSRSKYYPSIKNVFFSSSSESVEDAGCYVQIIVENESSILYNLQITEEKIIIISKMPKYEILVFYPSNRETIRALIFYIKYNGLLVN